MTDKTNVGLNEKKDESSVGRKRERRGLWVKRVWEGERKGVVKKQMRGAGCALTFFDHWCQHAVTEFTVFVCLCFSS